MKKIIILCLLLPTIALYSKDLIIRNIKMKTLVNSLNCRPAAWALALCVCTLFIAASTLAFSQISFEKIWEVPTPTFPIDPCFSKDGRFIYGASETNIMKFDAETGQFISFFDRSAFPQMYQTIDMAISPKGTYLMSHDGSTGIYLWDTKTDKANRLIPKGGYGLIMTLDEKQMIFAHNEGVPTGKPAASGNSNILIFDLEADSIIKKIPSWGRNELLALSSDGKYLATVAYKNESKKVGPEFNIPHQQILLWNTETWVPEVIDDITFDEGAVLNSGWEIRFSNDFKYFYWVITDIKSAQFRTKIYDISKRRMTAISDSARPCYRAIFFCDSLTYGFCYPEVEMFDLTTNLPKGTLDYPTYQYAAYPPKNYIAAFDFTKAALYRMKGSSIYEKEKHRIFTANYKEKKIVIDFLDQLPTSPPIISVYDINGKELLRSKETNPANSQIIIPIALTKGIYIINLELGSKHYSAKIEVAR